MDSKMCVVQSKNGIMINSDVNVKDRSIGVLVNIIIHGILVRAFMNMIKHVELMSI